MGTILNVDVNPEAIRARVALGAGLLDRVRPGWWREIALDRLAMHSCDTCVLGQLYSDFFRGCSVLAESIPDDERLFGFPASGLGFSLSIREQIWGGPVVDAPGWAVLADAWRAEVARRTAEGGGAPC